LSEAETLIFDEEIKALYQGTASAVLQGR